jgi:hypothetical protein
MPNFYFKFYFNAMRQGRSAMADFFIDCYFNGFRKGRKNFVLTLRYAKKLHSMLHSAELQLHVMPHSAEFRLHAMRHSAEFLQKVECVTPHYAS